MWITSEVELPDALVAAHREGRLVVFAGAGVSMGSPADLPSFSQLAERIASESGRAMSDIDRANPDRFLGGLENVTNVHLRVAAIIGNEGSRPTDLHRSLLRLAASGGDLRLVTTNYDRHFPVAAGEIFANTSVPVFEGPALPLGDDFAGIVHLHGSLGQQPRHLVVTDRDFGRAYLTDAWASQFLHRMFREYVVLFVGYSHNDVVMSYLARGLPRGARRFAFSNDPDAEHWRHLEIDPVGYPSSVERGHAALSEAIEAWAAQSEWGLLEHRQRVATLLASPPPEDPASVSYLEQVVADAATVGFFGEHARGEPWLRWASGHAECRSLFSLVAEETSCSRVLAWWFAEQALTDTQMSNAALHILHGSGGEIGSTLWHALVSTLRQLPQPRPSWTTGWIALLVGAAPRVAHDVLDHLLADCIWPDDRASALILFDHLTTPRVVLEPSFGFTTSEDEDGFVPRVRADIALRGSDFWLSHSWTTLFAPNVDECARELAPILERHLWQAHTLLASFGDAHDNWDPLSWRRSAIEPHDQDQHDGGVDSLVSAARDVLVSLLRVDPAVGAAYLLAWGRSEAALLRRLAVHGWTERSDVEPDEKLRWVRDRGWVFDLSTKHEVFRLIASALPSASAAEGDALVQDILAGPPPSDHRDYLIYNHLVWVTQVAPALVSARKAFETMQAAHPEFAPREHPDFDSWITTGAWGGQAPVSLDEFHHQLATSAASAIDKLLKYQHTDSPWNGPTWHDALNLVASTVAKWHGDGLTILSLSPEPFAEGWLDIWRSAVRGLVAANLEPTEWSSSVTLLSVHDHLADLIDDVARLLQRGSNNPDGGIPVEELPRARELAGKLWGLGTPGNPASNSDSWLSHAINSWAGQLAEFLGHMTAAEWRAAGDTWTGMNAVTTELLDSMVNGTGENHASARAVLASQLHFYFAADEGWCTQSLLPLFDWSRDADAAAQAWDGYLTWGRWSDRLLTAGLLDFYRSSIARLTSSLEGRRDRLCDHLAGIAVLSEIDPLEDGWLRQFIATADETTRVHWATAIRQVLEQNSPEFAQDRWNRWIGKYWRERLASVPLILTANEATAMAEWSLSLGSAFPEAVALVSETGAGLDEHSNLIYRLPQHDVANEFPQETSTLVAHLLAHTSLPFYYCDSLRELAFALRPRVDDEQLRLIVEQALRLGCADAATWI